MGAREGEGEGKRKEGGGRGEGRKKANDNSLGIKKIKHDIHYKRNNEFANVKLSLKKSKRKNNIQRSFACHGMLTMDFRSDCSCAMAPNKKKIKLN